MESGIKKLFAVVGVAFLAVFAVAVWRDTDREWKKYQKDFYQLQVSMAKTPQEAAAARRQKVKVKRYWMPELDLIDRCITCHLGVEDPRFVDAPQPFRTHPDISPHTFEKLACTTCHQGQGRATRVAEAHGDVEFWEEPLLRGAFLQSACANCHDPIKLTAAPALNLGSQLFLRLGCVGCHKVAGRGGDIGPDLTRAGKLELEYIKESLIDPKANDPSIQVSDRRC